MPIKCYTEAINGTFGTWGELFAPFTSVLGMFYLNTTLLSPKSNGGMVLHRNERAHQCKQFNLLPQYHSQLHVRCCQNHLHQQQL
jgi:hypothetical protein